MLTIAFLLSLLPIFSASMFFFFMVKIVYKYLNIHFHDNSRSRCLCRRRECSCPHYISDISAKYKKVLDRLMPSREFFIVLYGKSTHRTIVYINVHIKMLLLFVEDKRKSGQFIFFLHRISHLLWGVRGTK
jgi:hypothetical protein